MSFGARTMYHFTALRFLPSILQEGLTRGCLPVSGRDLQGREVWSAIPGFQWLTTNLDWAQAWTDRPTSALPYSRLDVRLTVRVPALRTSRLEQWVDVGPGLTALYAGLSSEGDPENWWIVRGAIPKAWIRAVDFNPKLAEIEAELRESMEN